MMSIINQTLRELDARKLVGAPTRAPQRPVIMARRGPWRWILAGVVLTIGGLVGWFVLGAAGTAPHKSMVATTSAKAPQHVLVPVSAPQVESHSVAMDKPEPIAALPEPHVATSVVELPVSRVQAKGIPKPFLASLERELSTPVAPSSIVRTEAKNPSADENADERYRKALALIQKGRENLARPLLEEAVRLSPVHVAARQALVALLSEAGENRESEAVLREGRAVVPDNAWFALSLARFQAARGDTGGAVDTLQSGLGGRGVNAEYHATLAALLMSHKQYSKAERQYEQSLKLQPEQGTWWMGLGLSLSAQDKAVLARAAYTRALAAGNLPENLLEFVRSKLAE